jgi:hypothetical protein
VESRADRNCSTWQSSGSWRGTIKFPVIRNSHGLVAARVSKMMLIDLRLCQHDNGYMDGRSHIKVHTDERTQVHSAQSFLAVTHPGTNRARFSLTSVTESPSKHWSPMKSSPLRGTVNDTGFPFFYRGRRWMIYIVNSEFTWRSLNITDDSSKKLETGRGGDLTMTTVLRRGSAVPQPATCALVAGAFCGLLMRKKPGEWRCGVRQM